MRILLFTDKNLSLYLAKGWSEEKLVTGKIKTLSSKTFSVELHPSNTILDLKKKIEDTQGIPIEKQDIRKGKTKLKDDMKLEHYFIRDGTTLLLLVEGDGDLNFQIDDELPTSESTKLRHHPVVSKTIVIDPEEEKNEKEKETNQHWWEGSGTSGPRPSTSKMVLNTSTEETSESKEEKRLLRLKAIESRLQKK